MSLSLVGPSLGTAVRSFDDILNEAEQALGVSGLSESLRTRAASRYFESPEVDSKDVRDFSYLTAFMALRIDDISCSSETGGELRDTFASSIFDVADLLPENRLRADMLQLAARGFSSSAHNSKAAGAMRASMTRATIAAETLGVELRLAVSGILESVLLRDILQVRSGLERLSSSVFNGAFGQLESHFAYLLNIVVEQHLGYLEGNLGYAEVLAKQRRSLLAVALELSDCDIYDDISTLCETLEKLAENSAAAVLGKMGVVLNDDYRDALQFGKASIPELWPAQRIAIERGALSAARFVTTLPTSAGKTLIAELKIAAFLAENPNGLVVYLAPLNALASQVCDMLYERLRFLGIDKPIPWTGSYEIDEGLTQLGSIVVMTPEKFDSVTRNQSARGKAASDLSSRLGLLIVDESHMVGAGGRGVTLELILARVKRRFGCQILAMSAMIRNPGKIAEWLSDNDANHSRSSWRPNSHHVFVYRKNGAIEELSGKRVAQLPAWKKAIDGGAHAAISMLARSLRPTLVIETQRAYAETVAEEIARSGVVGTREQQALSAAADEIDNILGFGNRLASYVRSGVAFHHAGLPKRVREIVEELARSSALDAVCATTTLAEGVDMPFRSLVLPHLYFPNRELMSRSLLQNIIGRAGRARVGVPGVVVICEGKKRAERRLIKPLDQILPLKSVLPSIPTDPQASDDWDKYLRVESQLLGVLSDNTFDDDDQVSTVLDATLCNYVGKANETARVRTILRHCFERMRRAEPQLATRNSPYRLTPFGEAVSTTGISTVSGKVLHREIIAALLTNSVLFQRLTWISRELAVPAVEAMSDLIYAPLEIIKHMIKPPKEGDVKRLMRAWIDNERVGWQQATKVEKRFLQGWLSGTPLEEIDLGPVSSTYGKLGSAERAAALNEYVEQNGNFLLWMWSAAIRIIEFVCTEEKKQLFGLRRSLSFLNWGVPNMPAVILSEIGVSRMASIKLAPLVEGLTDATPDDVRALLRLQSRAKLVEFGLNESELNSVQRALTI